MAHPKPSPTNRTWLNRNVIAMALTSLLSDFGHEMATAALPGFVTMLGLGPFVLGAIEGIADGVSSGVKLWAGRRSDRATNRKSIATTGYVLTGASKALFALAHGWPMLLVGRVLAWFGRGIRGPVRDAMLAESVPPSQVGRAFGFHRAGDTIGAVIGPLAALGAVALFGASDLGYRRLFLLTLVPGLASAVVFGLWTRDPKDLSAKELEGSSPPTTWHFRRFIFGIAFFGLGDFAPTLLMLRAADVLGPSLGAGHALTITVALYVLRNTVYAATAYPAGALSDRVPRHVLLAAGYGLFVLVAAGAAAPVPDLRFFAALFTLSGVSAGVVDTVEGASVADLVRKEQRGSAYGTVAAVNGVGDLISSLAIGALWRWFSPMVAFGAAAILAADAAMLMLTFRARRR